MKYILHKNKKYLKLKNQMLRLFSTAVFKLRASNFGLPTSDFQLRSSVFQLRASNFGLPTSVFRLRTSIFGLLTFMLFSSCTQKTFNNETALLEYIKEETNGYTQHKTINGVDYTLMYRPTDMLVKQELGDSINSKQVNVLRNKYSKYLYFNLSMSKNNQELLSTAPKNRNEFGQMVNQLAFGMNEKVHVYTQGKDTLEMADFIYPRMYGMSRATTIMFVYPRAEKTLKGDHLNFTIEDLGLYTGEVKFKVPTDKLENEPQLAFNK